MLPTMKGLVEYTMYISQGGMLISVGYAEQGVGSVPGTRSKLAVGLTIVSSAYPQKNNTPNLLNPTVASYWRF